jgi:hypothetical protein
MIQNLASGGKNVLCVFVLVSLQIYVDMIRSGLRRDKE